MFSVKRKERDKAAAAAMVLKKPRVAQVNSGKKWKLCLRQVGISECVMSSKLPLEHPRRLAQPAKWDKVYYSNKARSSDISKI